MATALKRSGLLPTTDHFVLMLDGFVRAGALATNETPKERLLQLIQFAYELNQAKELEAVLLANRVKKIRKLADFVKIRRALTNECSGSL